MALRPKPIFAWHGKWNELIEHTRVLSLSSKESFEPPT